jgi:hypothetical protein
MTKSRAAIPFNEDFSQTPDFSKTFENVSPQAFLPESAATTAPVSVATLTQVAAASGFQSREPHAVASKMTSLPGEGRSRRPRRIYRTGRNTPLNIKARPYEVDKFNWICTQKSWVQGVTLQNALVALEEKLGLKYPLDDPGPPS